MTMLSVFILNGILLSVIMLKGIMLSVIMLNVVMLSVMVPRQPLFFQIRRLVFARV
jgi:hypothetical protein